MTQTPQGSPAPGTPAAAAAARSARALADPVLAFDLVAEAERLRAEGPWHDHGRNAVTLAKYPDFRIVFMLMKPGTRMQEHQASARISIQTVSGLVRLHLKDRTVDLPAGHVLALERDLTHDVEALEESGVLLTIAWAGAAAHP
jgi:quercetin dioxygenase-like cupin family protein